MLIEVIVFARDFISVAGNRDCHKGLRKSSEDCCVSV